MADKTQRWEDNVAGAFYVDKECILCSLCTDVAPDNFAESEDGDHDYVFKQPENEAELEACRSAMEACPVDAIGDDGA
jgi:ferredoxin